MSNVLIDRKVAKKVESIFEHPDKVYSVYLKAGGLFRRFFSNNI